MVKRQERALRDDLASLLVVGSSTALAGAMNWYPSLGTVRTKRGFEGSSPSTERTCAIQKLSPPLKSTNVLSPQRERRSSSRETTRSRLLIKHASTRAGCDWRRTVVCSRRRTS